MNRADCGYQVHKTEREISHLYVNGLKLLLRDEDEMGRACDAYGAGERGAQVSGGET